MNARDEPARQRPGFPSRESFEEGDLERGNSLPDYTDANDPYSLRHGLKSDEDIDTLKANVGRKRSALACGLAQNPKAAWTARKVQGYYEQQNEDIERFLKPVDEHVRQAKEERESEGLQLKIAVNASFIANVLLAVLQVYAAASSKSLSLFTTMADAIFDPCSNLTLILASRAVKRVNPRKYVWPHLPSAALGTHSRTQSRDRLRTITCHGDANTCV